MRNLLQVFAMAIGLIAAPFVLLFHFLFDRNGLRRIIDISQKDWLSDKRHIHRIQFEVTETTPMVTARQDVCLVVHTFVAEQNYLGLADYLAKLDQDRVKCPGNKSLSIEALQHFADLAHIEGNVGVETEDGLPARLTALSSKHPEKYALAAMAAALRLREAWAARGDGYANSVSKRSWDIAENRAGHADSLLSKSDPAELNSPLLAYSRYQLLPFVHDARDRYLPYYQVWTNLDPICQRPHEEVGFKLLPRWFGDLDSLEEMARHAAAQTQDPVGLAAYYKMFSCAIGCDPIHLVIDVDMFVTGARDLMALRRYDPAAVTQIYHEVDMLASWDVPQQANPEQAKKWADTNNQLRFLLDEILADHITQVFRPGWDGGVVEALNRITDRFRAEMDAGCHFEMGDNGITVLPPEPEPALA